MLLKTYYPSPGFPPISISGDKCTLKCRHCSSVYLKNMIPSETPEKLTKVCRKLDENNAVGILLSGGYNKDGKLLNLERMLPAVKKIKKETKLII
ncbi:MAG: radical SAM protein, partial [Candidatus Thermoplasmatota archaeon]|nr:radical SAM protein [Candidatus Thermoplasmatota archaeon]